MRPSRITFDPLYGFIKLTKTEDKIIHSKYYQRLRWIQQLGFSSYIFPGATHNRFSHAMGVMHMADKIIHSIGMAVPDEKLYDENARDPSSVFHKSVRISALLHDIGTFPFSHTCEGAYIRHGESSFKTKDRGKNLPNNHEHLGAYILKNSTEEGGISQILADAGLDPTEISKIVKGSSKNMLANQLLHSELDADRMDYLMRDAHYTGVKYGHFDRDYILYHLTTFDAGKGTYCLGVKENAMHAVEDFLISRFSWYSQVVRGSGGARFDIMAETVTKYLLEKRLMYQFQDLLQMIGNDPDLFFGFNDHYFMGIVHQQHTSGKIKDPGIKEMVEMLLYRQSPIEVKAPLFEEQLLTRDEEGAKRRRAAVKRIDEFVSECKELFRQKGDGSEWILHDIPDVDITFAKNVAQIVERRIGDNLLAERDPIKIVDNDGKAGLLVDDDHSILRILSNVQNFIPSFYMNRKAKALLEKEGLLAKLNEKKKK